MAIAGTPFDTVTITQFNLYNHALAEDDPYRIDGRIRAQAEIVFTALEAVWIVEYQFTSAASGTIYGSGTFIVDETTEAVYSSIIPASEVGQGITLTVRARMMNTDTWSEDATTSAIVPSYLTSATVVPDGVTISGPTKSIFDSSTSSTLVLDWDWTNGVRYQVSLVPFGSTLPVFNTVLYGNSDLTPYTISNLDAGSTYVASVIAIESGKLASASLSDSQLVGSTSGLPASYLTEQRPLFATKAAADAAVANYRIGQVALVYNAGQAETGTYLKVFNSVAGSGTWVKLDIEV